MRSGTRPGGRSGRGKSKAFAGYTDRVTETKPTSAHSNGESIELTRDAHRGPVPTTRIGELSARMINGVFGDPLLWVQLLHRRRSLLFDLGDPGRMAARIAHQVTDIFFSHTHADHIGGFLWFLRSRVGVPQACRLYGPAGLAEQVAGMVGGILWDRVGGRAPRFEIREWHGERLQHFEVVAGQGGLHRRGASVIEDGCVWREPGFLVRATQLDHGTPVLAYALELRARINVCPDKLQRLGLPTGPWLQELKTACLEDTPERMICLPDGRQAEAGQLRQQVLLDAPGAKLVYATDFAETAENHARMVKLARSAHSLFCESPFTLTHSDQARLTGHLTTRACAEIANAAGVTRLLPFHFSKRYIRDVAAVYAELASLCAATVLPPELAGLTDQR